MPKPDDATSALGPEQRAKAALELGVPQIYFNGFVNALSTGDIHTVLERNGKPVAILNFSYTLAKTLAISLGTIVSQFEEATGRTMLTTHEVEAALSKLLNASETKR